MSLIKPEQLRSGSYNITGSLFGTSSLALTASYFSGSISSAVSASYALTASYALNAGGTGTPFRISTGSISASVDVGQNIFIITKNNIPVLTVSQSGIVIFATQSQEPVGTAPNGAIYFTSASFYVSLD
jgi:hypothetical protein